MRWLVRAGIGLIVLVVLLVAVVLMLPPPEMPKPDGEHKVGVTEFEVAGGKQFVHIMAWYPAAASADGERLVYTPGYLAEAFGAQQGVPAGLLKDERPTESIVDAEVLTGRHPVLLFNHGYGSFSRQSLTTMEQLASHGYIVLALGHPGHSLIIKRVGGELVPQQADVAISPAEFGSEQVEVMAAHNEQLRLSGSMAGWKAAMEGYEQGMMSKAVSYFDSWLENNQRLLNALPEIDGNEQPTNLAGHLDLDRLAVFGHSYGGALASHLAMNDERVKAGFNLDGPHFSFSLNPASKTALCFAYSTDDLLAGVSLDYSWINSQVVKANAGGGCEAVFTGAGHMNFSDLNHLSPLKYAGILGSIDSKVMHSAANAMLLGFFNQHLGNGQPLKAPQGVELRVY